MTATTNAASIFTEGFVEAGGRRIRYLAAGDGPPVLQIHGGGGVRLGDAEVALAEKHRVIAVEVPGYGAGDAPSDLTAEQLAPIMLSAAQGLGLDRFSLIAMSMGTRIALQMALAAPESLDALILVAPAAIVPEGHRPPDDPEARAKAMAAHPERREPAAAPDAALLQKRQATMGRIMASGLDVESHLGEIETATLVLFGTEDGIIPPEAGRIYRAKMPNCSYALVYDAAHDIQGDRPEAYVNVVLDFLERHEVFVVNNKSTIINP